MAASIPASVQAALNAIPNELLLVMGCLGGLLVYALVRLKRRGLETIEIATQHAEAGQLHAAAELLAAPARAKGATSFYAQAALANLHLREGRLGHAVWVLNSLASRSSGMARTLRRCLEHGLAYAFAVGGALEMAERHWSVTARIRDPISPLGCLLLCKRSRFGALVELTNRPRLGPRNNATIDPAFDWHGERVVALLCAFAYVQEFGQSATSACRVDELLEAARPTYAGEYDYLLADWAELRDFVQGQRARLRVKCSHRVRSSPPRASVVRASTGMQV